MKKKLRSILNNLNLMGIDLIKFIFFFRGLNFYVRDFFILKNQMKYSKMFNFGKFYPVLDERFLEGGTMNGHYFHQDLLIAQKIYLNSPKRHIDIGSRIDGFVAHVASFREIEIFDIRQVSNSVKNIVFTKADLTTLPENLKECCDSLSSLHAIEHFGLGRYGDEIDINGHLKAIQNIYLMLKSGGKFYFSVPIGKQRIEFNAHRIFSVKYLIDVLSDKFEIDSFNYVDDKGQLYKNVLLTSVEVSLNFNCIYGCGIFELTKK